MKELRGRHGAVLALALVTNACLGDDGFKDTVGMMTTGTSSTTTSDSTTTWPGTSTSSGSSTDTGATGSTSTSSASDTDTETGCTFLDCSTTGSPSTECDIWKQDCHDGQKCMPWANDGGSSWNATKCSPVDPNPGKPGDPCKVEGNGVSGIDDCEKGAMCWNVDGETMEGYCIGFCDGSPESYTCAEEGTICTIVNNGVLILCLPTCDPLLQDCMGGDLCLPGGEGFICVIDASGEDGQFGDPCEFANVCDPGLACMNPEYVPGCQSGGCCSPFCELDVEYTPVPAPTPKCPDEQMSCLPWFEMDNAPPGYSKVGVCGIPQ